MRIFLVAVLVFASLSISCWQPQPKPKEIELTQAQIDAIAKAVHSVSRPEEEDRNGRWRVVDLGQAYTRAPVLLDSATGNTFAWCPLPKGGWAWCSMSRGLYKSEADEILEEVKRGNNVSSQGPKK